MYHCDDCDLAVHENDRENHLSGARHKYRVRQKHSEIVNSAGGDVVFDNAIKPTARRVPIQGMDKYLSLDDLKESCDYKSTREKYRPKNTKNQEGHNKSYTSSVTAYWAVTLALDPTVNDFKICINEKDWGDFGDAVIEIQLKETTDHPSITTTFAVQFKYISNNVKSIDSFNEGRFCIAKYITQISKIKGHSESENKKFILFTTASTDPGVKQSFSLKADILHKNIKECVCNGTKAEVPITTKTLSNRSKLFVNTSDDNETIYFFFATDSIHSLPKLYLYTRQKKLKNLARSIDGVVNDKLNDKRVEIHRDLIKYIEYWGDGFLGGNYRLKKEDVLVKLGHLLLYEFRVPPQVRVKENPNYGIWNQAVNSVDVTILTKHHVIISKVCMPINAKIEKELGLKIDTTTSTVKVNQDNINNIQNSILKMYLFEETCGDIQDDIPLDILYDVFWKAGLIPMILDVKNEKAQHHILELINIFKSLGLTRRYFLTTSDQNIRSLLKYYKTLSFFISLDDVARKLPSFLLDYVKISASDSFSISLKTIQDFDLFFQKAISANEFFDMSLGQYSFKSISNQLARREQGAADVKLVLDDLMMKKIKDEIESEDAGNTGLKRDQKQEEKRFLRGIDPGIFF